MAEARLRIGEVFRTAAGAVRTALGPFLALTVLSMAWAMAVPRPSFGQDVPIDLGAQLGWMLASLLFLIVYSVLYIGLACIALDACSGRPVEWRRLWPSMSLMSEIGIVLPAVWFGASAGLIAVGVFGILFLDRFTQSPWLFVVAAQLAFWPVVVLGLGWSQFYNCLIDGTSRWLGSMSDSWRLTRGQKFRMFLVYATLFVPALVVLLPLEISTSGVLDVMQGGMPAAVDQLGQLGPMDQHGLSAARVVSSTILSAFNVFVLFVHAAVYVRLRSFQPQAVADGMTAG